jgi:hypothetical protein
VTILLTVGAALVLLVAGFWYFGRKPATHRDLTPAKLERLLTVLLNQGYDGGVLFIRGRRNEPFLQVMKYAGRNRVGLQLDFPRAPWAMPYLPAVERALQDFDALPTGGWTAEGNDLQFLTVDFGTDVKRAAECVDRVANDALNLPLARIGRAQLVRVSSDRSARIGF